MNALEIFDLRAGYGKREVLHGVSLQVPRGQWFCLLGPNGVGKTTLLHCIAGRLRPASGDVCIMARSLSAEPAAAKRQLGHACAPEQLPGLLTGRQCLEVHAIAKALDCIDADVLTLAEELRFTQFMDGCVDTYSLGTRQKLCVLLALLGNPALVVLDEAFNGLDPRSALVLKQHLRQRVLANRCSILLATHALDVVERHADSAALMLDGMIAKRWTPDEIRRFRLSGNDALESELATAAFAD